MLCFECIDEFSHIQAAFHGCIQDGIAQQKLKSSISSHFGAVEIVEPFEIIEGHITLPEATPSSQFTAVTIDQPNIFGVEQTDPINLTRTSNFTNLDAIEVSKGKNEQIGMMDDDEIIADFDISEFGDIDDYFKFPSFELLENLIIFEEDTNEASLKTTRKGTSFKCIHCAKTFTKSPALKKHVESTHQKTLAKRQLVHRMSPRNSQSKKGKNRQVKSISKQLGDEEILMETLSYCNICPKAFQSLRGLALHKRTHNVAVLLGKLI